MLMVYRNRFDQNGPKHDAVRVNPRRHRFPAALVDMVGLYAFHSLVDDRGEVRGYVCDLKSNRNVTFKGVTQHAKKLSFEEK